MMLVMRESWKVRKVRRIVVPENELVILALKMAPVSEMIQSLLMDKRFIYLQEATIIKPHSNSQVYPPWRQQLFFIKFNIASAKTYNGSLDILQIPQKSIMRHDKLASLKCYEAKGSAGRRWTTRRTLLYPPSAHWKSDDKCLLMKYYCEPTTSYGRLTKMLAAVLGSPSRSMLSGFNRISNNGSRVKQPRTGIGRRSICTPSERPNGGQSTCWTGISPKISTQIPHKKQRVTELNL